MRQLLQERGPGWDVRLSFAALLLVFSELVVWQTPGAFNALEWAGLAALYVALAAIMLDLIARLKINDVFSLFLLAGLYGLLNATLISHVTARDLPLSLIIRPFGAQPLAFLLALGSFHILASGRATGPLDFVIALVAGLAWGIWVRWFPLASDEPVPDVPIATALAVTGVGLVAVAAIRFALSPASLYRREDWLLPSGGWLAAGSVLGAALVIGAAQGLISRVDVGLTLMLGWVMGLMLYGTLTIRPARTMLDGLTPLRRPNLAAWLVIVMPFLVSGWIGYGLPGSGETSPQSDLLFGALTGFGVVWPPAISTLIGIRAFIRLTREGA